MTRVAAIQMASGPNVNANLIEAGRLIADAAAAGAQLVVLPENFAHMGVAEHEKLAIAETAGSGPIQEFLRTHAARHGVWVVGGTVPLQARDPRRVRASCLVFNAAGEQVARYDKIHLFDVHLEATGEDYNESETIEPGEQVVVIDSPFGRLGIAVCYDIRFPELFRSMLEMNVELIAVPSAFTAITGKAHWEILVRARAIENLCYVIAADQGGYHVGGRETYGDSMIVDPWGQVLDRLPHGSNFVVATIDQKLLTNTRRNFPVINHRRLPCNLP